jgi:protein ImuB
MGIRTIGQFAALSRTDVASVQPDAVSAHQFARGEPERDRPACRRRTGCRAAVIRRSTGLTPRHLPGVAERVASDVDSAGWMHPATVTPSPPTEGEALGTAMRRAVDRGCHADRVRWQLDGWLGTRISWIDLPRQ